MKKAFPFDPLLKHHLLIGVGLAVWVFVFLFFTEPLDVTEFSFREKLTYLPLYGLFASLCYLLVLPLQQLLYVKSRKGWTLQNEILVWVSIFVLGFLLTRTVYYYIVVDQHPNAYDLLYFFRAIYLPALMTILPIIAIGRWSFGKYREKKIEESKIEINGSGQYEGLRLHLSQLICVQSADNYIEVNYLDAGSLKKQLIRNTLSEVERSLPELLRTHRSFLINPQHFIQWKSGNRKLSVVLSEAIEIPVSATFKLQVEEAVNSATSS